jgi:hypothetical protein
VENGKTCRFKTKKHIKKGVNQGDLLLFCYKISPL